MNIKLKLFLFSILISFSSVSFAIDNSINAMTSATTTINVTATNNGSWVYIINGVSKPDLTLEVGTTYTFNYPGSHPLRFSTVNDGIFNGGVEYTQDVDTSGTNQITIRVTSSTAKTLYYYCRIHARQGGKITVTQ